MMTSNEHTTATLDVQRAVHSLTETLEALDLAALTAEQKADLGQALWNLTETSRSFLEPLKMSLRDAALAARNNEPGSHAFLGPLGGKCLIIIPQPTLKLRKGVDVVSLSKDLGQKFDLFFDTQVKYVPRKSIQDELKEVDDPEVTSRVLSVIDIEENTPRVSFTPKG